MDDSEWTSSARLYFNNEVIRAHIEDSGNGVVVHIIGEEGAVITFSQEAADNMLRALIAPMGARRLWRLRNRCIGLHDDQTTALQ